MRERDAPGTWRSFQAHEQTPVGPRTEMWIEGWSPRKEGGENATHGVAEGRRRERDARRARECPMRGSVERRSSSSKGLDKAVDEPVEPGVFLPEVVDLAHRMNDGGVVLAAELLPDLREGGSGQIGRAS